MRALAGRGPACCEHPCPEPPGRKIATESTEMDQAERLMNPADLHAEGNTRG